MDARLHTVIRRFTGSLFLTPAHRQRMELMKAHQGHRRRRDTPAYFSATRGLAKICKEGVDAIGSTIKELEKAGYIIPPQPPTPAPPPASMPPATR